MNIVLDYTPRNEIVDRFHDRTERVCCWIAHRRFGKTVGIANDGIRRVTQIPITGRNHAPPRLAWMYPTRVRAKDIAWSYLKYYSRAIPGVRHIESELAVEFADGRRFTLYGADGHRGVGQYLDGIYYDERDDIPDKVIVDLAPTLTDYKGFEVHAGMLRGRYKLWKMRERTINDASVLNLLVRASESHVIPDEELAMLKESMGAAAYDMQLECNPNAAIANAIYGMQMDAARRENRITKVAVDRTVPLDFFADIGHSLSGDDWSWWGGQTQGRDYLFQHYLARTGQHPSWYAARLIALWDAAGVAQGTVYLPHDGARQDRQGRTAKDDLEAAGIKRVKIVTRPPNIWDSINNVRAILPRCFFDQEGCGETWMMGEMEMPSGLDCLDFYTKKEEATTGLIKDVPVHNQYSHGADALRTFAEALTQGMLEGTSGPVEDMRRQEICVHRDFQPHTSQSTQPRVRVHRG